MSKSNLSVNSFIPQTTINPQESVVTVPKTESLSWKEFSIYSNAGILILLVALVIYGKVKLKQLTKAIDLEKYKNKELQKRLKLALDTMRKWETNPDLIHSRDWNLDYVRMRMEEEVFHNALVNQAKIKVQQSIKLALRSSSSRQGTIGIANTRGCKIDETFDITYETDASGKWANRTLFRVQIKLMKLPMQSSSKTILEIIECIKAFLSPMEERQNWQPTVQGYIVRVSWDQKAKPTPLLLLEQYSEGINVSFRTNPLRKIMPKTAGNVK